MFGEKPKPKPEQFNFPGMQGEIVEPSLRAERERIENAYGAEAARAPLERREGAMQRRKKREKADVKGIKKKIEWENKKADERHLDWIKKNPGSGRFEKF